MPARIRPVRRTLFHLLAMVGCIAVVTVGCGGGDDDAQRSDPTVAGSSDTTGGPGPDQTTPDDDDNNPVVLGLQVRGPAGASVEFELVAYADGQAQQPTDMVANVRDEPWYILLTTFIDSAEVNVNSVTGGPVTIETVRGRAVDPENSMAGIEVHEVLETVEVADGSTAVLEMSME